MQLSKIGEFGLIEKLLKKSKNAPPEILAGIGDDAAVIRQGNKKILITTDMLLEGVHFDLSFTTFFQLGHKFLAVNISDIFAMGGNPKYFFISIGIPKNYRSEDIEELYSGILKIAGKFGVAIAGGDTCASGQGLILSGTLVGNTDRVITRAGAKAGDGIFVTGALGDSAMGLMLLKRRKAEGGRQKLKNKKWNLKFKTQNSKLKTLNSRDVLPLIKKHLMPEPVPLEKTSKITSMIDISDGLLIDLSHICDKSMVGAVIRKDKIPVSKELAYTAKVLGTDPVNFALKGGEDYALLFTAPQYIKTTAFKIGEIVKTGRFIIDERGRKTKFKPEGYEHFKKQ
jgi:thiamine-monophosphate kinase